MNHHPLTTAGLALCAIAALPGLAAEPSAGQLAFETRCAMCHGTRGAGDGWLAEHLINRVPSLTRIKQNNNGVFPFERIYEVIDGRAAVRMHGPRTMPVWGEVYRAEYDQASGSNVWRLHTGEAGVRARVLALIEYISQLQE